MKKKSRYYIATIKKGSIIKTICSGESITLDKDIEFKAHLNGYWYELGDKMEFVLEKAAIEYIKESICPKRIFDKESEEFKESIRKQWARVYDLWSDDMRFEEGSITIRKVSQRKWSKADINEMKGY